MHAIMVDFADPFGSGEYPLPRICNDGVVGPTPFPQFIDHLYVIFGGGIAVIVLALPPSPMPLAALSR
jgi:hypothetical protein